MNEGKEHMIEENLEGYAESQIDKALSHSEKIRQGYIQAKEFEGELWIKATHYHIQKQEQSEPYGYFRYDIRLDAWVQSRDNNKGVAFYTTPQVAYMRMPKVGDRVVCIEDEDFGMVQSLTAGGSPEIKFDDGSHGTYLLREFAELFRYADTTPQTKEWVGLTEEELIVIKGKTCPEID